MIVHVALSVPRADYYDYLPCTDSGKQPGQGCRVEVSFGNRTLVGVIVGTSTTSDVPASKLKRIIRVIDSSPVLDQHLSLLIQRAARYYHHSLGDAIATALPKLLRQGKPVASSDTTFWDVTREGSSQTQEDFKRAPRQWDCLHLLQENPGGQTEKQLDEQLPNWRPAMRQLGKKALVDTNQRVHCTPSVSATSGTKLKELTLNLQQQNAVDVIRSFVDYSPCLLQGVTGSGKTEVYLAAISPLLEAGKQCLVIVPEISLTPQLLQRFSSRFEVCIACLHSGLNDTERLQAWRQAQTGVASIIIGTRSAIFVPLKNPGLILVDEEHDSSLKQQEGFRYHARDMAVMRAQMLAIPVILGSATPSLETVSQAEKGLYTKLLLDERAGGATPPKFEIVDLRNRKLLNGFSTPLVDGIRSTLEKKQQVLLFINRRGYAPAMLCHDCGEVLGCPRCTANMTWHNYRQHLRCHHCGHTTPQPEACSACKSTELVTAGMGTEQIEQTVKQLFPDASVIRIDRDTMSKKNSLNAALSLVAAEKVHIIIGTQLLAKGHDFPGITLVALMDVDQSFYSVDFRAAEKMTQQVLQVGGRAGRGQDKGRVIIQTHQPEHPLLHSLISQDFSAMSGLMLDERKAIGYPPFSHLALIRSAGVKQNEAESFLGEAGSVLKRNILKKSMLQKNHMDKSNGAMILGPVPAPMEKRAGRYRFQLLLQSDTRETLHNLINASIAEISSLKSARRTRWSIDIDPIDMN